CAAGCSLVQGASGASPARSSARRTPGATDNTSPRSPRSGGLRPPCSGPARPEHRPAAASQRSLHPAKLLAPPIIRHLAHPDLADLVHHVLALRDQNIDPPQLRNDLFRLVSLPCHCSPPECQRHTSSRTTSMGVDQRLLCLC